MTYAVWQKPVAPHFTKHMKRNMISIVLRILTIALGVLLLGNALIVTMASNFNLGILLTYLVAGVLIVGGVLWHYILRYFPRWLWITVLVGLACVIVSASALLLYGQTDRVTHNEDVIIVLGAGIHGERVSLTLRDRRRHRMPRAKPGRRHRCHRRAGPPGGHY